MTDTERIDKIERLAKAAFGVGSACFCMDHGELGSLPFDPTDEKLAPGWYATVREAIDAAPEGK